MCIRDRYYSKNGVSNDYLQRDAETLIKKGELLECCEENNAYLLVKKTVGPFYACKAGLTTCYVTTDGGIYTCAELPEFKIGSVEAGLDVPRIREIIYPQETGVFC